jgi:hypothetical protein
MLHTLLAALTLGAALVGPGSDDATRVETFALFARDRGSPKVPLGVARWSARRAEDGTALLERELLLFEEGLRLLHTEELPRGAGGGKLVWREMSERAGRTLLAERLGPDPAIPGRGARLRTVEGGTAETVRRERTLRPGTLFPLELAERLRAGAGEPLAGAARVLDPLAGDVAPLEIRSRALPGTHGLLRRSDLRREDGSLVATHVFAGSALLAFAAGELSAVRIGAEEHRSHRERALSTAQ